MPIEQIWVPYYCRAPRRYGISLILLHATRGPTSMADQYAATVNWFRQGGGGSAAHGWGGNADVVIGFDGQVAEFGDWRTTRANWSAGFGANGPPVEHGADEHALSIELAQPTLNDPFTEACIASLVEYIRPIITEFNIPLHHVGEWDQLTSQPVPRGFIGHEDTANGRRFGKSDPGPQFPWLRLFSALRTAPPTSDLDLTVVGTRIERETRYLGYDRELGAEVHETREYIYRAAP